MTQAELIASALKITLIDLVLSGDNAVVIAMASRSLPKPQQKKAIFWGGIAAVALRVVLTALISFALKIPLLQVAGGLMLFYIAVKLLKGSEDEHDVKARDTVWGAIGTIVLADFVMSLDNMLAVGGASEGNLALLLMGLALSMGLILFASGYVADLMNRWSWLVYLGGAILAWTAGDMIEHDKWVHEYYHPAAHWAQYVVPAVLAVSALVLGYLSNRRAHSQANVTN